MHSGSTSWKNCWCRTVLKSHLNTPHGTESDYDTVDSRRHESHEGLCGLLTELGQDRRDIRIVYQRQKEDTHEDGLVVQHFLLFDPPGLLYVLGELDITRVSAASFPLLQHDRQQH